jgi:hypothetical protein
MALISTGTITAGVLGTPGVIGLQTQIIAQLTGSQNSGIGGVGTYLLSNGGLTANSGTVTLGWFNPQSCAIPFGNPLSIFMWGPHALIARAVSVTAAGVDATPPTFVIRGYDIYGYPMTESILGVSNTTTAGKKAWKYIKSVTPTVQTGAGNWSVGTTDVYGFPIRSDSFGDVLINYAASLTASTVITAATGYLPSDQRTPTISTGDVRGTYALQSAASTGVNRLTIRQSPQPYNLQQPPNYNVQQAVGLFGQTQFSNF